MPPRFSTYIGIDYSGAKTPEAGLPGLQVFRATRRAPPVRVAPPDGRRHWSRLAAAHWLLAEIERGGPCLVGIDHSFSFPRAYFARHRLPPDWDAFLDDFVRHWPTGDAGVSVDLVRAGACGRGAARRGEARWRREAEVRARAKSVFHFDVQGQVAKSAHAGLPWLRFVRRGATRPLHVWPFDGWVIPKGASAIVEAYPRLWSRNFDPGPRTPDEHDAYSVAAWLREADRDGRLAAALRPKLNRDEKACATFEGWILGVDATPAP